MLEAIARADNAEAQAREWEKKWQALKQEADALRSSAKVLTEVLHQIGPTESRSSSSSASRPEAATLAPASASPNRLTPKLSRRAGDDHAPAAATGDCAGESGALDAVDALPSKLSGRFQGMARGPGAASNSSGGSSPMGQRTGAVGGDGGDSDGGGVTKRGLQLIKATAHEIEVEVPSDKRVRAVHKAETLVRFSYLSPPRTFLMLKKPDNNDITRALFDIGMHLSSRAGAYARLIVEPSVFADHQSAGGELDLLTWDDGRTPQPPAASIVSLASLASTVDLVVCVGGDGTLLWASGLFKNAMPPVVSFSMGSLGFLTPFSIEEHASRLDQILDCGCHLTLRSRLHCRIERAGCWDTGGVAGAPAAAEAGDSGGDGVGGAAGAAAGVARRSRGSRSTRLSSTEARRPTLGCSTSTATSLR